MSQIFLDLVGKTLDEVRPRGWLDRLPPEDLKPTLDAWRECVRTGGEWSWEHRVKGKDGVYRTILSLGRPVRDDNGRISSWVGFNLDISERKQAEEALARHVGLLTAITDSAADAIFVSDDRGRVTLINPAAERIFGWSRRELAGRVLHDAIHNHHPDGRPYPASECALRRVYETGETLLRHEDVFFRKDGSQVQVACSNAPLMIEGRIAGSVLVAHDITERKRSEQALRESEARLRRTVEYAPFPIMVHAEDGEVVHISQAWLALTGYSREEIATVAAWTERAYGERKEMVRANIDQLYALDQAIEEGEYLIRTADGGTRVWAFSSSPLGSDGRGRRLVVSMAADVTDRKEAERALSESEIRVRALLDASQDEILLLSAEGMVLAINKAAQRRLAREDGRSRSGRRSSRSAVAARPGGVANGHRPASRLHGRSRTLRGTSPGQMVRFLVLSGFSAGSTHLRGRRLCSRDHRAEAIPGGTRASFFRPSSKVRCRSSSPTDMARSSTSIPSSPR